MAGRIIFSIISHVVILESSGQSKASTGLPSDTYGDVISTTAVNVAVNQSAAQSTIATGTDSEPSGANSTASGGNSVGKTADNVATASDTSGEQSNASGASGECVIMMPRQPCEMDGLGPAEMWLSPKWTSTESWKDEEGTLSGALAVEMMWQQPSCTDIELQGDHRDMITASNFAGGSSSRLKSAVKAYSSWMNNIHRGSVTYVGAWHQNSDGSCYPFDVVKMTFNMTVPAPFSKGFTPKLFCNRDDASTCTAYSEDGIPTCAESRGVKLVQTNTDGIRAKGFRLSSLTCEVVGARFGSGSSSHKILCSMSFTREDPKRIVLEVVPGLIMLIIGYGSFLIPPSLAMPRVATCMIALLTFVGKGTAVLSGLPLQGLSLVEFFYLFGMASMLVNMVGHIVAFRYPRLSSVVDILSLQVSFCSTLLVHVLFLLSRDCSNVDRSYVWALVAISASMLLASFFLAVWRFKTHLTARIKKMSTHLDVVKFTEDEEPHDSMVRDRNDEQSRRADGERELQQRRPAVTNDGEDTIIRKM